MAFTEEDLASWDMKAFANERVEHLHVLYLLAARRTQLPDMPKPTWWTDLSGKIVSVAKWYCHALDLPGLDLDAWMATPDPKTEEGKALTKHAVNAEAEDFVGQWLEDAESALRLAVTTGRRCSAKGGWKKADKSLSNKLANCIMKERNLAEKMSNELVSMSG